MSPRTRSLVSHIASWLICGTTAIAVRGDEPIDFNRDVRPILSDNCFACHGFDETSRAAGLRLDTREGATEDLGGYAAIVSGQPQQSELIKRVTTADTGMVMPPPDSHKQPLDEASIDVLSRWIQQGAVWGKHWSFEPPRAVELALSEGHPIDQLVSKSLAAGDLELAPRAAVHTLARRLSFDLTGLPPGFDEVTALGDDPTAADWQAWIDRLLDSPAYGERMAMWWLDGARYADTDGFQQDATRQNWPWRDWVIDAFNDNMPFDRFTLEQFAGDLLPDATDEQKLATCFHRNHMHNGEGGRDPAESRVDYVLDRTNTMGTLWLGLTLGCTQCHDHKFDPISQQDYYGLTAFFNSIDEDGKAGSGAGPFLTVRSPYAAQVVAEAEQLVADTEASLAETKRASEAAFHKALEQNLAQATAGFQAWKRVKPAAMHATEGTELHLEAESIIRSADSGLAQDDFHILVSGDHRARITGVQLEVFADPLHRDGKYSYAESGEFILTNIKAQIQTGTGEVTEVGVVRATASVEGKGADSKYGKASGTLDDDPRTGWTTRTKPLAPKQRIVFELERPVMLADDQQLEIVLMQRGLAPQELLGRFRLSLTDQRGAAVRALQPMPMERLAAAIEQHAADSSKAFTIADLEASLRGELHDQFLEDHAPWQTANRLHQRAKQQLRKARQAAGDLKVTVLAERTKPRTTHVLQRGVWDQHGDAVQPSFLPAVLPRETDQPPTRLELAQWIVSRDNPLTARVITNQIWQLFFGAGLVRTPGDFGLQGESPTHPELLDWLAVDFMQHDWDVKHLVRRIVTSRTYQQDSSISSDLLERDPENRLLARGARFRLPSWMIRDASLKQSGLLNPMLGGPPVFPYQPPGIWEEQFMGRFTYQPTLGPGQYRRTVYAFWRRSSAPTFLFDTAMRRTCEVIPRRTNTPLQALTLMNNRTAQEAARTLAEKVFGEPGGAAAPDLPGKLAEMFRTVLSRQPNRQEQQILQREYEHARRYFEAHRAAANTFTTVGQLPALNDSNSDSKATEIAAGSLVASLIFNLDEALTHE